MRDVIQQRITYIHVNRLTWDHWFFFGLWLPHVVMGCVSPYKPSYIYSLYLFTVLSHIILHAQQLLSLPFHFWTFYDVHVYDRCHDWGTRVCQSLDRRWTGVLDTSVIDQTDYKRRMTADGSQKAIPWGTGRFSWVICQITLRYATVKEVT